MPRYRIVIVVRTKVGRLDPRQAAALVLPAEDVLAQGRGVVRLGVEHAGVLKDWIARVERERGVVFDLKDLPAYSPNLNLIERLWKFLRQEALPRWQETFEAMQQAVADVLDHLDR